MHKLLTGIAIAAALASPALAKKHSTTVSQEAAAAQASVPAAQDYRSGKPPTVIVNGEIVGRDSDPNIRLMLLRDPKADAD